MIAAIAIALLSRAPVDFYDTPEMKRYVKLIQAYGGYKVGGRISLLGPPDHSQNRGHFEIEFRKPDFIHYRSTGVGGREVIWNGKSGIDIDLFAKTYSIPKQRPRLDGLDFLAASFLPDVQLFSERANRMTQEAEDGTTYVGWRTYFFHVDAGFGTTSWFNTKTGMPSTLELESYSAMLQQATMWRYAIEFTFKMPDMKEFDLTPPKGYKLTR